MCSDSLALWIPDALALGWQPPLRGQIVGITITLHQIKRFAVRPHIHNGVDVLAWIVWKTFRRLYAIGCQLFYGSPPLLLAHFCSRAAASDSN